MLNLLKPIVICLFLSGSVCVHAATAIFQSSDKNNATIVIETANGKLRIGMRPDQGGYVIAQDAHTYMISTLGGRTMVMDLLQMAQLAKHAKGAIGVNMLDIDKYTRDIQDFTRLTDTRRRETVAGITGNVYMLVYQDGEGKEREVELVLAQQPALASMTHRLLEIANSLHAIMLDQPSDGIRRLADELRARQLGLLRFTDQLSLQQFNAAPAAAERFALPQGASQLQDTLQNLKGLIPR